MYLSIVVTTYKRIVCLQRCLQSLILQDTRNIDFNYEIIVAIDNRDKETWMWMKEQKEFKHIRYVLSEGQGANAVRNKGIKSSEGDIIFFLDDDCVVPNMNWLKEVVLCFREYINADVIGGAYICDKTNNILDRSRCLLDNYFVRSNKCSSTEVASLLGGNCGYKKETFYAYGFFDERISYGWAETELHSRIRKNGGRIIYYEPISVYHIPEKRTVLGYFIRSFKQGVGHVYSLRKNGMVSLPKNVKKRLWFYMIAKDYTGKINEKCIVGFILFCLSVFYFLGKIWGCITCKV